MVHKMTATMQRCIDACLECFTVCAETATHCLELGGQHAKAPHIRLLKDCSIICMTHADLMLGNSQFQDQLAAVCIEVCERCADDCEEIGSQDELMKRCADTCRHCADVCSQMHQATATAR
jgi:hypothetical protein